MLILYLDMVIFFLALLSFHQWSVTSEIRKAEFASERIRVDAAAARAKKITGRARRRHRHWKRHRVARTQPVATAATPAWADHLLRGVPHFLYLRQRSVHRMTSATSGPTARPAYPTRVSPSPLDCRSFVTNCDARRPFVRLPGYQ